MDQEACLDLGEFDEKNLKLDGTPGSGLQYLQQTAAQRSRCPAVVRADPGFISSVQPSSSAKSVTNLSSESAPHLPPEEWCIAKCSLFSQLRSQIELRKSTCPKIKDVRLPLATDRKQWIKFCCLRKPKAPANEEDDQPSHSTLPVQSRRTPTIPLMLHISENRVNCLAEHLTQFFLENGYSRELFEWFYGVLLVVQKPLVPDTCVALRDFAKHAKFLRSTISNDSTTLGGPSTYELTLFIAIISMYFEQKDLADYPQVSSVKCLKC